VAQRFTRTAKWNKTLLRADVLALAQKVEQLVAAEMPDLSLSYDVHLKKPESNLSGSTLDDLDSELDDGAGSRLHWADVYYHGRQEAHGDTTLHAWFRVHYPTARRSFVSVDGADRTAVEGIGAQVQEFGNDLLRTRRVASATAVRARLQRWLNNPWLVTIAGGVIVGLIVALVLSLH